MPPPPGFTKQWNTSVGPFVSRGHTIGTYCDFQSKNKTEGAVTKSLDSLKASRAWGVATQPAKQIPMNLIMLYMSGSQVQIFSMGVIVMLLWGPFVNFFKVNNSAYASASSKSILSNSLFQAFAQYAPEGKDPKAFTTLFLQKAVFLLFHLVGLAIGLWKCQQMGLLPTGTGDWLAFETRGPVCYPRVRSP